MKRLHASGICPCCEPPAEEEEETEQLDDDDEQRFLSHEYWPGSDDGYTW